MKKLVMLVLSVFVGLALVACTNATTEDTQTATTTTTTTTTTVTTTGEEDYVQGVTDTTIKVGNTAAVSGAFAVVGIPFNDAIKAVFKQVNDAGGIGGRTIEFVTYDDQFNAELGVTYTEQLVEDDEVFALVGHFGTPTVGATLSYIQEQGVPMVYAATGINSLYFEETPGNPIMAVQPIYLTDGRIMTARAFQESLYGTNHDEALADTAKVGVLYTNDDVGNSIKAGVETEAAALGISASRLVYIAVTAETAVSAVAYLKAFNVSSVILAMNQAPFAYTLNAMYDAQLEVPVFTSYVNADITAVDHLKYSVDRPIYTNAWVDVYSTKGQEDVQAYIACISNADLDEATKTAYYGNSFAIAGYIAATVFVEGLKRVDAAGLDLTWANYIAMMEDGPISIPMGGVVDFSNGHRWGIASMSLLQYTYGLGDNPATTDVTETDYLTEAFVKIREIETISEIEAK
ncbi:MAG: ABC transporter substrate-binding protein [Candidatus Izemoplasmatales bacterium]